MVTGTKTPITALLTPIPHPSPIHVTVVFVQSIRSVPSQSFLIRTGNMRVTASRVYSRPVKVPKMPPGLVELMEGLTKDVLKNDPPDVYEFCANHMQKLLELRDGPTLQKPLTLEQKITLAQEKVKLRAEKRWQKYLEQIKETEVDRNNKSSAALAVKDIAAQNSIKPIHHEQDLKKFSEIEIAVGSASSESAVSKRDNLEKEIAVQEESVKEESNENENVSADIKSDDNVEMLATEITETNIEQGKDDIALMSQTGEAVEGVIGKPSKINDAIEGNIRTSFDGDEDGEKTNVLTVSELSDQENTASVIDVSNTVENSQEECPHKIMEISTIEIHKLGLETSKSGEAEPDLINHSALLSAEQDIEIVQDLSQPNTNDLENVSKILSKDNSDNRELSTIQPNLLDIPTLSQIDKIITLNNNNTENISDNGKKASNKERSNESTVVKAVTETIENEHFNFENKTDENDECEIKIVNADKSDIGTKNLHETKIDDSGHKLSEILTVHPINIDTGKIYSADEGNNIIEIESAAVTDTTGINSIEINESGAITTKMDGNMETNEKADDSSETEKCIAFVQMEQNLDDKISEDPSIAVDTSIENPNEKVHIKNELDVLNISKTIPIETKDSDQTNLESQTLVKCNSLEDSTNESNSTLEGGVTDFSEETVQNDNTNSMDLETAAVTIQKVFRTFLFKSRASTFDDSTNEDNNLSDDEEVAELKDDRSFMPSNLNKERRSLGISRMDTVLQTVNEEKSLSLSTDDSSLSSAATIIQAHVRGFLVRNKFYSGKTVSSNSLVNSNWPSTTSIEGDIDSNKNKTVLNIHIVPEGGNYLSRDESMITSMDLSLDGSPPSSVNLHPLGYDKSERRKRLKREDAVQSVSPPSNNSGKLSEDSVKELPINGLPVNASLEQETVSAVVTVDVDDQETAVSSVETVPLNNLTVDIVLEEDQKHKTDTLTSTDVISQASDKETPGKNKGSLSKQSSDEMDVVTPYKENLTPRDSESVQKLVHSGEFHDTVLPTKVSRSDTPVASGE